MALDLDVRPAAEAETWRHGSAALRASGLVQRLWARDHTLWSPYPVGILDRLGWLDAPADGRALLPEIRAFADELREEGFDHALVVGMGGASLAAEMIREAYGVREGHLDVEVSDTTHPDELDELLARVRPETTVLILSMKAWALESYATFTHLYDAFRDALGPEEANRRVVVITDPDAWLLPFARSCGFRRVFVNDPFVGGRYAAHTHVGLLPAALLGVDLDAYLARAEAARARCAPEAEDAHPFGTALGLLAGDVAAAGRDKLTFLAPARLNGWLAWVEQLVAESLGKDGSGVLPVVGEEARPAERYGNDRAFVLLTVAGEGPDRATAADLERLGHPVAELVLDDVEDLPGLCFLWMFATAVAGARLGVQPFDQPDVEATKARTAALLPVPPRTLGRPTVRTPDPRARTGSGGNEPGSPAGEEAAADAAWTIGTEADAVRAARTLAEFVAATHPHGYLGLQAFVPRSDPVTRRLAALRQALGRRTDRPVTLGIGPRYLHSTGQLHKGDAGLGTFVQITTAAHARRPVAPAPGSDAVLYDFASLNLAQARADAAALRDGGRAVLRLHLDGDPASILETLTHALDAIVDEGPSPAAGTPPRAR